MPFHSRELELLKNWVPGPDFLPANMSVVPSELKMIDGIYIYAFDAKIHDRDYDRRHDRVKV